MRKSKISLLFVPPTNGGGMEIIMMICEKEYCTGCGMCVSVCPKGCIKLEVQKGFYFPVIDQTICINCKICQNRCPQNNAKYSCSKSLRPEVFCAQILDTVALSNSSSGGMFYAFASYFIENLGGYVFASSLDSNLYYSYNKINSLTNLLNAQGSMYIQSDTKKVYQEVKDCLKENYALFIGCPCQVAALKSYLGKENRKLLTMDLVCHGVGSFDLFKKHIMNIEQEEGKRVHGFRFRCKDRKSLLNHYLEKLTFEDGNIRYIDGLLSPYMAAYFHRSIYRESCYKCRYASIPRVGDITLGDYVGIDRKVVSRKRFDEGVSLLIINNEIGKYYFEQVNSKIWYIRRSINEVLKTNANVSTPSIRPSERDLLDQDISAEAFLKLSRFSIKNIIGIIYNSFKLRYKL